MRRMNWVCVTGLVFAAACAAAQDSYGPAQPLQPQYGNERHGRSKADKHCATVGPGDTVTYTLVIDGLAASTAVFSDLQMRPNGAPHKLVHGLPPADFSFVGGGGQATATGDNATLQFSFRIAPMTRRGVYRTVGLIVSTSDPANPQMTRELPIDRRTMREIDHYCLNVTETSSNAPRVVEFRPDGTSQQ